MSLLERLAQSGVACEVLSEQFRAHPKSQEGSVSTLLIRAFTLVYRKFPHVSQIRSRDGALVLKSHVRSLEPKGRHSQRETQSTTQILCDTSVVGYTSRRLAQFASAHFYAGKVRSGVDCCERAPIRGVPWPRASVARRRRPHRGVRAL